MSARERVRAALRGEGSAPVLIPIVNGFAEQVLGRPAADTATLVQAGLRLHALFGGDALIAAWDLQWQLGPTLVETIAGLHAARADLPVGVAVGGLSTGVDVDELLDGLSALGEAHADLVVFAEPEPRGPELARDGEEVQAVLAHFELPAITLVRSAGSARAGEIEGRALDPESEGPVADAPFSISDWCWGPPLELARVRARLAGCMTRG